MPSPDACAKRNRFLNLFIGNGIHSYVAFSKSRDHYATHFNFSYTFGRLLMRTTLNPTFRSNLLCRGLKYSSLYHLHYISPAPTMGGFAEEYKVRNFDHEPMEREGIHCA